MGGIGILRLPFWSWSQQDAFHNFTWSRDRFKSFAVAVEAPPYKVNCFCWTHRRVQLAVLLRSKTSTIEKLPSKGREMACLGKRARRYFAPIAFILLFFSSLTKLAVPASPQEAASNSSAATSSASKDAKEPGFPVTDPLVVSKCGACHQPDTKGNLSRISWIRTTPEGWEEAIKRMVRLHGLALEPSDARKILRYLSDDHGLAPDEAKPVAYIAENRMIDEKLPNEEIVHACNACHALGKPLSWRRSADDWKLLANMHIAFFPAIENTSFQRPPRRPDAPPLPPGTDTRPPVEQALSYFAKNAPLQSAEWSEWHASMRTPKLNGRWLVYGTQPGKGRFFGEMSVEAGAAGEAFSTKTKLTYVSDGSVLVESGKGIVYTGYAWRGRENAEQTGSAPDAPKTIREVMMLSRDQSQLEGRWFWGAYQEFGMDVSMRRASESPTVLGVDLYSLKAGSTNSVVRIYGDHLAQDVTPNDLDLGSGVTVKKILSKSPGLVIVNVDVAKGATPGKRDVAVKSAVAPGAFAVYDRVDYVKVTPQTPLAHLGSDVHAKGYCQFEAIAYNNGPDAKSGTADDIELGPVPAQWKLEEFVATYGDDDVEYVGTMNAETGLFTPALDGPNPKRKHSRNNYGDVWAVATVKVAGTDEPLTGKSYLIVSVPQYIRWDQPEVAR